MPFLDVPSSSAPPSFLDLNPNSSSIKKSPAAQSLDHVVKTSTKKGAGSKLKQQNLIPQAGFVVKSSLEAPYNISSSPTLPAFAACTKVFINLAHSPLIPIPPTLQVNASKFETTKDGLLWIPAVVGVFEVTKDKKGVESLVVDVCFHTAAIKKCDEDEAWKEMIIEEALSKLEEKFALPQPTPLELSRSISLPKTFKLKGELKPRTVVLPVATPTHDDQHDDVAGDEETLLLFSKPSSGPSKITELAGATTPATKSSSAAIPKHSLTFPAIPLSSFTLTFHLPLILPSSIPTFESQIQLFVEEGGEKNAVVCLEIGNVYRAKVEVEKFEVGSTVVASWIVERSELRIEGRIKE